MNTNRPYYLSDNGPRPKYRGYVYKITQDYSITSLWIVFYLSWAVVKYFNTDYTNHLNKAYMFRPLVLLIVRFLHAFSIYRNHFLSDALHNHDKKHKEKYLSSEYKELLTKKERIIHAEDWIATLGLGASHHILFLFAFLNPYRIKFLDIFLLGIQIAVLYYMARQIDSDLLTPDKPLYKKFQMSLAIQGIIIGIAILRRYKNNYIWLKIYGLVTIGVLCTGFKWPKNPVWGYHEILHCSVILMNLLGIVTDISRNF